MKRHGTFARLDFSPWRFWRQWPLVPYGFVIRIPAMCGFGRCTGVLVRWLGWRLRAYYGHRV